LELGTGSGVISFELLDLGLKCDSLSCLELQSEFYEHFETNRQKFASAANIQFINVDFFNFYIKEISKAI
jgi:phospholipid N-methyltransferase